MAHNSYSSKLFKKLLFNAATNRFISSAADPNGNNLHEQHLFGSISYSGKLSSKIINIFKQVSDVKIAQKLIKPIKLLCPNM